ncbi:helix-turn-helix domain-containing protein [Cytobacillus suaedae]|nr:helix-turn-helix domain-containing protein [Cytobacillus suaedae]
MGKTDKVVMGVKEIMDALEVGRDKAYGILHSEEFHVIRVGSRLMVHKDVFESWLKGEGSRNKDWRNKDRRKK